MQFSDNKFIHTVSKMSQGIINTGTNKAKNTLKREKISLKYIKYISICRLFVFKFTLRFEASHAILPLQTFSTTAWLALWATNPRFSHFTAMFNTVVLTEVLLVTNNWRHLSSLSLYMYPRKAMAWSPKNLKEQFDMVNPRSRSRPRSHIKC